MRQRHCAFSLLEVLLALVILGGAVAVIGQTVRQGMNHSRAARNLTRAEILCESVLAEIVAGSLPAESAALVPIEDGSDGQGNPMFSYSVEVEPVEVDGLVAVNVTVVGSLPNDPAPVEFSLSRWMIDPAYQFPDPPAAEESSASSTSESSATQNNNTPNGNTPSTQTNQGGTPTSSGQRNGQR